MEKGAAAVESSQFLNSLSIPSPPDAAILHLGAHPKERNIETQILASDVHCSTTHNSQNWEQVKRPSTEAQVKKMQCSVPWNITQPYRGMELSNRLQRG